MFEKQKYEVLCHSLQVTTRIWSAQEIQATEQTIIALLKYRTMKLLLSAVSLFLVSSWRAVQAAKHPVIFDSDYGPFIDDVFALGLLINSGDLIDLKLIVATSEKPDLSAKCIAAQLAQSERSDIDVAVGKSFPPYEERGSVCAIEGLMGFAMEPECLAYDGKPLIENGLDYMATMIIDSDRDDWWYIVVGGQSSLKALIQQYPEAATKIDTLIVMAGNFCGGFEPYPGVMVSFLNSATNGLFLHMELTHKIILLRPLQMRRTLGVIQGRRTMSSMQTTINSKTSIMCPLKWRTRFRVTITKFSPMLPQPIPLPMPPLNGTKSGQRQDEPMKAY
jgi:Inosine-uridine preferring nucleoside hydrolase